MQHASFKSVSPETYGERPPIEHARPLRYALYVRKSTEEDERQSQSIQSQTDQARELAARTGRALVLTLEESRSAKEPGRAVSKRRGRLPKVRRLPPHRLRRPPSLDGQPGRPAYL